MRKGECAGLSPYDGATIRNDRGGDRNVAASVVLCVKLWVVAVRPYIVGVRRWIINARLWH